MYRDSRGDTCRQYIVDQHDLCVCRHMRDRDGGDTSLQIAPAQPRGQPRRITDSPPQSQTRHHLATTQTTRAQPPRRRAGHPQHRVTATPARRRRTGRRRNQHQRAIESTQAGQAVRQRRPERLGQIPAPAFLGRQHRLASRAAIAARGPARDPRVDARPHPERRARQALRTLPTPADPGPATAAAEYRHHQIEQCPHRPSVPARTDTTIPRRHSERQRRSDGRESGPATGRGSAGQDRHRALAQPRHLTPVRLTAVRRGGVLQHRPGIGHVLVVR